MSALSLAPPPRDDARFSLDQENAIRAAVRWYIDGGQQVFYLAGPAGTGKTHTLKGIIEALQELPKKQRVKTFVAGAYSAQAADVMRKKGFSSAGTLHSHMYSVRERDDGTTYFVLDRTGACSEADLIVVDEASMVPRDMAEDMLSFGKPVIVVGDPYQLPPVSGDSYFTAGKPDYIADPPQRGRHR